jgi:acyl-CoA reductase-like NAD-dependent aldehyde dehydrogenase
MRFTILAFILFLLLIFPAFSNAQSRDYLTDAEIELVRDAQQIDLRVEVLIKAVERRIAVVNNTAVAKEDVDKWGDPPKGTRVQLLSDIAKILQKAVDDVDDVARREEGKQSKFFIKAMHKLADAAQRFQPQFKLLLDGVKEEKERGSLLTAGDLCASIIEASAKVPKEIPKEEKKKEEKKTKN